MPLTRITTDMLEDLTVGTGDIADSAVTALKLAADAVTTPKILDLNVTTQKLAGQAVTPAKMSQPLTQGTVAATTSGTERDFAIPVWAKRIRAVLQGVSLSGTALLRFRLGTSGGIVTSGYLGAGSVISSGSATVNQTAGFDIYTNVPNASYVYHGAIDFTQVDPTNNIWVAHGVFATSSVAWTHTTAGVITLSGALTTLRLTSSNGTDTLDAGSINVLYD